MSGWCLRRAVRRWRQRLTRRAGLRTALRDTSDMIRRQEYPAGVMHILLTKHERAYREYIKLDDIIIKKRIEKIRARARQ